MDKNQLINKIKDIQDLTNDEKSALLELLNTQKKYGLVWEDKSEDVEEKLREELPILKEVKEYAIISEDKDAPNHILIEGDNLEALTSLCYTHEGKIDVIYIDPPYNTGNKDFIYNDSFVDKEDSFRHSKWLSFMSRRLKLAKQLLSDKGVIFISIDDNEASQLKLLCDEIFGELLFRNLLLVRRRTKTLNLQFASNGLQTLNIGCEYIFVYAKNGFMFKELRVEKKDIQLKGTWNVFWSNADRPTMRYELLGFTPATGQWRWSKEKATEAISNYNEYIEQHSQSMSLEEYWHSTGSCLKFIRKIPDGRGKNGGIQYWVAPNDTYLRTSNWTDIEVSQIHKNFDLPFNNPKNLELIKEILQSPFHNNKNIKILDFFAGSGTTLHATMELNKDGGNRQCILVTNNENNICKEVTYERNKRVINGYSNSKNIKIKGLHNNNLRYYRTEFIPREQTMSNMRKLVLASTDLLCIKENIYSEKKNFGKLMLKPNIARYFESGDNKMLVIYNEETISYFINEIDNIELNQPIKVYVFSPGQYAFDDDFFEVANKVVLCALPAAIYAAYKKVLPKRKDSQLEAISESENTESSLTFFSEDNMKGE